MCPSFNKIISRINYEIINNALNVYFACLHNDNAANTTSICTTQCNA